MEGILQVLSSLQSWNSLKTHNPTASSQHLWAASNPCPTPWLLLSWVSPHWFPCSWHTGEGSPNCVGRKRPTWDRGENTGLRVQPDTLGSQLEGDVKELHLFMCVHAKLLQCCLTLCDPLNYSPPGSSVHGILERVSMPSSRGSSWPRDRTCISYTSCISR